jgi:multidrug resistance efflux pump
LLQTATDVEASEMLQAVGKRESNLNTVKTAGRGDTAGLAQIEAPHDTLKAQIERLKAVVATIKHELHAGRDDDRKELDQLTELFSTYQRLAKGQAGTPAPVFQRGATPKVQAVSAAQRQVDCHAEKPTLLEGLRSEGLRLEELRLM